MTHHDPNEDTRQIEWVRVDDVLADEMYQRPVNKQRVLRMAEQFDPDAVGAVEVSRRADGTLWAIDGRHRIEMFRAIGWGDQLIPAVVHEGLSVRDEARIFRLKNAGAVKPDSVDLWHAAYAEGDAFVIKVTDALAASGYRIKKGPGPSVVQGASMLRRVAQHTSVPHLVSTLNLAREAWGEQSVSFASDLMTGLALVRWRYASRVDDRVMTRTLSRKLTPHTTLAAARSITGGEMGTSRVPFTLVNAYNGRRQDGLLPPWEARTGQAVWRKG